MLLPGGGSSWPEPPTPTTVQLPAAALALPRNPAGPRREVPEMLC